MPTQTTTRQVAANLRAEMARQGMTQASLAAAVGLSQQAVSRRLTGRGYLTVDDIERFAAALNVSTDLLIDTPREPPAA